MTSSESPLKNFLEASRFISRVEADELWQESKGNETLFVELLVECGKLTEDDLQRARGHVWGLPLVDLVIRKLSREALQMIPEPFARERNVIGYDLSDKGLEVALLDPIVIEELSAILPLGFKLVPRLTTVNSIKYGLKEYRKILQQQFGGQIQTLVQELKGENNDTGEAGKLFDLLISHAKASKTSIIYIEPGEDDLLVRYRLGVKLYDAMVLPVSIFDALVRVAREKFADQVSFISTVLGERMVIRFNNNESALSLESLGMRPGAIDCIESILAKDRGLILISGQSSSGKSSLGYSLLDNFNVDDKNVSTVEDHITRRLARVTQTVVGGGMGLGAVSLLRSSMRQDPDVVLVDEIREGEVASLALNFALSRGLALAVAKGKSAIDGLVKFAELVGGAQAVASGVKLVVNSAVIRRLGEKKERYFLTPTEIEKLQEGFNLAKILRVLKDEKLVPLDAGWETVPMYRPALATEEGYKGLVGVYEILPVSLSIKDLLLSEASDKELSAESSRLGNLTLAEEGLVLAVRGLTTIDEVLRTL